MTVLAFVVGVFVGKNWSAVVAYVKSLVGPKQ